MDAEDGGGGGCATISISTTDGAVNAQTQNKADSGTHHITGETAPKIAPKPSALQVNIEGFPAELKDIPHWVLWKYDYRPDQKKPWTKPPYQPNGRKAKANDPATWSDFSAVWERYQRGGFDGIGIVLTPECGIVGGDVDNALDESGNFKDPELFVELLGLDTYTEKSPSGMGMRFFARGSLPEKGRKRGDFEMYNDVRFLTITGQQLEGTSATDINERSAELTQWHSRHITGPEKAQGRTQRPSQPLTITDEKLIEKACNSRTGDRFLQLWHGDASSFNGDMSAADFGLCTRLAFWTGRDAPRIDRLFRQSALMRPKWDERHSSNGATYGQMTIETACEKCSEIYDPGQPRTVRLLKSVTLLEVSPPPSASKVEIAFPSLTAEQIPPPKLLTEKGIEYEGGQLVEVLRPHWKVASLSSNAAHAVRIQENVGDDVRFSPNLGWLSFNGRHWEQDDKQATLTANRVMHLSQVVRAEGAALYQLAGTLAREGRGGDAEAMSQAAAMHTRHAKQIEAKSFVEGALHFLAGDPAIRVQPDAFDQRPWLIGFQNGVWDKGEWREHRREDYLLHLSPIEIDFEFDCREWLSVLARWTGNDAALQQTLQDIAGYILSGASHLRFLPWAYGPKGTGKSTFSELLQTILGGMSITLDTKRMQSDSERSKLGFDLWNKRLAVCSEAGNQYIGAELLKTLSGGDTISVRPLYFNAFDATPRHVLLMVANDAPKMDAYDDALKDRVFALPFIIRQDEGGPLELTGGARIEAIRKDVTSPLVRGFAVWALEGLARLYQTQTISKAPIIEEATAQFWADTDPLTPFWETVPLDELVKGISTAELHKRYASWCESEGIRKPYQGKKWAAACRAYQLEQDQVGRERVKTWVLPPSIAKEKQKRAERAENKEISKSPRETSNNSYGLSQNQPFSALSAHTPQNGLGSISEVRI